MNVFRKKSSILYKNLTIISALAVVLLALSCLQTFATQIIPIAKFKNGHDGNIKFNNSKIEFYGLTINENNEDINCIYNSKKVYNVGVGHIFNKNKNITDAYIADDYPNQGVKTLFIPIFTGGANCCFVDLIVTKTENSLIISAIDSGSGHGISIDAIKKNEDVLVSNECVKQTDLQNIDPDATGRCTATAPRPESSLVFENDQWRFTKPKEKSELYSKILSKEIEESSKQNNQGGTDDYYDKESLYSNAVAVAYYSIMEGKSDLESANILEKIVPSLDLTKRKKFIISVKEAMNDCKQLENKNLQSSESLTANKPVEIDKLNQNKVEENGRFRKLDCGSIIDTKNNLEWFVGPDETMTFDEAKSWIKSLNTCGTNWWMPTIAQLSTLYEPNKTAGTGFFVGSKHWPAHIDPIFSGIGNGSWAWSTEEINGSTAKSYNLNQGTETRTEKQNKKMTIHAFAVRKTK